MLNREEIILIYVLLSGIVTLDEKEEKLVKKLGLIVDQLDLTEAMQMKVAEIQDKIVALESSDNNETKEN